MSDEFDPIPDDAPKPKKSKLLLIVGAVLFLVSNGVWGGLFLTSSSASATPGQGKEQPTEEVEADHEAATRITDTPGPMLELDPFVVNLNEPAGVHYLRLTINLELRSEEDSEKIQPHMVALRDQFITHLSSQQSAQLRSMEDKQRLRTELLEKAQMLVSKRAIHAIYFTEFIMQ